MRSSPVSRRVRTNRTYSLLVTCGLLAITVIQLPKAADLFHQLQSQQARHAGLVSGTLEPQRSAELDVQLAELKQEFEAYQGSMIGVSEMPIVQSELMELAQESNCKLRKSVGQSGTRKTWTPLSLEGEEDSFESQESPFQLSVEQLSLSLEGSLDESFNFLQKVREREWLMKCTQITFARAPDESGQLTVEINLSFYKLTKIEKEEELIQWREGPRSENVQ